MNTVTNKGTKKAGSAPSSANASLAQQKTILELMAKEPIKEQTSKEMQMIISSRS